MHQLQRQGFPDSSVGKESTCNEEDPGSIPGLGRSAGEVIGYPLQYSGLQNSMDCIIHRVTKSWTQLSDFHFTYKDITERPHMPFLQPPLILTSHADNQGAFTHTMRWWWWCSVTESCPALCDPVDCSPPGSSVHGISQPRILEWGCQLLLQGIFPNQGSDSHLLHWQVCSLPLGHLGRTLRWQHC